MFTINTNDSIRKVDIEWSFELGEAKWREFRDINYFQQNMRYVLVFPSLVFSITLSYKRFFQTVVTFEGTLRCTNFSGNFGHWFLDRMSDIVSLVLTLLENLTIAFCPFYLDTPDCCISW